MGYGTHNTTDRASTSVNRSQVARDVASGEHNAPSRQSGEQESSGPGHRTHNATHRAGTPVSRSQVARDTAHAKQSTERARR